MVDFLRNIFNGYVIGLVSLSLWGYKGMKVNIGPYGNWYGPYQISNWFIPLIGKDRADKLGDMLCGTWVNELCNWIEDKKKRKVKVHIHDYDVWAADHTLALIIVPILKKLKETKQGAPIVDDDDVPEHLKSTSAPPVPKDKADLGHTDALYFSRWEYVLNEMIWTFEQHANVEFEDQFYSGEVDIDVLCGKMVETEKHTFKVDVEGLKAANARCDNGRRLFAKYYRSLWD